MAPRRRLLEDSGEDSRGEVEPMDREVLLRAFGTLSMEDRSELLRELGEPVRAYSRGPPLLKDLRFDPKKPEPTFEAFVSQLRSFLHLSGVDLQSSVAVQVAGLHLEGEAIVAWHTDVGSSCKSFEDWCQHLQARVRPVPVATLAALDLLRAERKPGESLDGFVQRFDGLAAKVQVADLLKYKFVLCCPESWRHELLLVSESGMEGLKATENRAVMMASLREASVGPRTMMAKGQDGDRPGFTGKCYHCGDVGHSRRHCPKLRNKQTGGTR